MKLSVSLPEDVVEFIDEQTRSGAFESRSAVLRAAVTALRQTSMSDSYSEAWQEWEASGEDELWSSVLADGLGEKE
ncbi:MAG: ribbon-helix-helix protein, CopG family [Salinibacterium sp.]|nr:ribbon-helix-helix domain-containing protein [Salinibacterium sp.]MBF0673209.1 ribbon-helix-helix protein, CopG family [Salinibacterium sp.]